MGPLRAGALALLCAADLLVAVDGMVVTVALPAIQREFSTPPEDLQWVVTAYTLSLGAFLLVGGRAADLYGRRRVFVVGLTVFALASLAAGLAPSTSALLAARAVQGFGAALAIPSALALISASYRQERERERAVGLLATSITCGMGAGLVLGGMLTAWLGWPWCFFIVVPFGLAAAALAPAVLEESRDTAGGRLDVLGALLAAAGFGLVAYGLALAEHDGPGAALPALAGVALLAAFVAVERRTAAPMVRLGILRHRPLTGANVSCIAHGGTFGGMMFMTTLYMQQVLGFSAIEAGMGFLPMVVAATTGGALAPRIVGRVGARRVAIAGHAASAAAFVWLTQLPLRDGYVPVLLPVFVVTGFALANAFVALTTQGMTGVRDGEKGLASGLYQTSMHLGGALVLAVMATAAAARTASALDGGEATAEALTSGFAFAFLIGAIILTLSALNAVWTLPARKLDPRRPIIPSG
jgi:EmrB/QacA subfamily drug resistance transporter